MIPEPSRRCPPSLALALAMLAMATQGARADAPSNQVVPDPPPARGDLPRLSSVVNLDLANGRIDGTGSIVGTVVHDGIGYIAVLTADHVFADGVTQVSFGNHGNPPVNAGTLNIDRGAVFRFGSNPAARMEDLAVVGIVYGRPDAAFNALPLIHLAANPTIPNFVATNFTAIGYGRTGTFDGPTATYTGTVIDGFKRFIDNTSSSITPNADGGAIADRPGSNYRYDALNWRILAPGTGWANAGGTTFDADSGSPYLISGAAVDSSGHPTNDNYITVGNNNLAVNTDSIMAVHTLGANVKMVGNESSGVYLSAADDAWILASAMAVPEPGSLALAVLGGLGLVAGLRRRRRAA